MPFGESDGGCYRGDIEQNVIAAGDVICECLIESFDQAPAGSLQRPVETAEVIFGRRCDGLQDADGAAIRMNAVCDRLKMLDCRLQRGILGGFVSRNSLQRPAAIVDGDQHRIHARAVDCGARRDCFGEGLPEVGLDAIELQAKAGRRSDDC
jgi:hypothetical protein